MKSFSGVAHKADLEPQLRVVDNTVAIELTLEEAHELFERVLNSSIDDSPASVQAMKKLANAIGTAATQ